MAVSVDVYRWLIFAHILGALLFLLAHGASASVGFRLRSERDHERLRVLLDLSGRSYRVMAIGFLWILASGIILGVAQESWTQVWFWTALILLFVLSFIMTPLVAIPYNKVRKALGLKAPMGGKRAEAAPTPPIEEIPMWLERAHPVAAALVGFGGIVVIVWLMVFKPF
jgi:hypothetical protein